MSDLEDAVEEFLSETDTVYREYDKGYMDADAAISRIEKEVEDLREEFESE